MEAHELCGAIEAEINGSASFWFDSLSPRLAKHCWTHLSLDRVTTPSTYRTGRFLEGSRFIDQAPVGFVEWPGLDGQRVTVESLQPGTAARFGELGLEFYPRNVEIDLMAKLNSAIEIISQVPEAVAVASSMLSTLHFLKPECPEYDVSYSAPNLPFSIFVGASLVEQRNGDLRLAESILHECMHLQLTLIETHVLLVETDELLHHSPWKRALRPTRGVMHGLYVFRIIQEFFRALQSSGGLSDLGREHITDRLSQIDAEVKEMGDLSSSTDLTRIGRTFVERMQLGIQQ